MDLFTRIRQRISRLSPDEKEVLFQVLREDFDREVFDEPISRGRLKTREIAENSTSTKCLTLERAVGDGTIRIMQPNGQFTPIVIDCDYFHAGYQCRLKPIKGWFFTDYDRCSYYP